MNRLVLTLFLLWLSVERGLFAQTAFVGMNPVPSRQPNLTYFEAEPEITAHPAIVRQIDSDYLDHPELLTPGIQPPCANCTERVDLRTPYAKYFYDNAHPSRFTIYQSNAPIHYRDAHGWWRTIDPKLRPVAGQPGVYVAPNQPAPTRLDLVRGYAALRIGKGLDLRINERVRVFVENPDGVQLLGEPQLNAAHATVGHEGVFQKSVLENLDREIIFSKGLIKTNYILRKAPENLTTNGNWIVEEEWEQPAGTEWVRERGGAGVQGLWYGSLVLVHRATGDTLVRLRRADIWDSKPEQPNRTIGAYRFIQRGRKVIVQLVVPGQWLLANHVQYPVTVDPLLEERTAWPEVIPFKNTPAASLPVPDPTGGFTCASQSRYCSTTMNVNLPAQAKLARVSFQLEAVNQAALGQQVVMVSSFFNSTCDINEIIFPGGARGIYGGGGPLSPGSTIATRTQVGNESVITPYLMTLPEDCPAPSCTPSAIPFEMRTYQCGCETANDIQCVPADATVSCMIIEPNKWVMVAEGNTVEPDVTSSAGRGETLYVCVGDLVTFQANAKFGVPPYTYRWELGGAYEGVEIDNATGRLTHRPTAIGTYRYTINYTDACGAGTDPITYTVVVRPGPEVRLARKKDYDCTPGLIELAIAPNTEPPACVTASADCPPRLQRTAEVTEATLGRATSTLPDRTPFNGNRSDFRVQYMYPRAVLTNPNINLRPGKITQIAFLFQNRASIIPYRDFRIKMGCTDRASLRVADGFVTGLNEVFYRREYRVENVGAGAWLQFDLDNAYVWDGQSNLVIEFSYNNQSSLGGVDNVLFFAYAGGNPSPNTVIWSGPPANPDVVGENLPAAQEPTPTRFSFPVIRFRQCAGELWNKDGAFYSSSRNIPVAGEDPTGLRPGLYDFFYIDDRGCSSPLQVRIDSIGRPVIEVETNPCTDPNVLVRVRDATSDYEYAVSASGAPPGPWQAEGRFRLRAGTYDFHVRDLSSGCVYSVPAIDVPESIAFDVRRLCPGTIGNNLLFVNMRGGSRLYEFTVDNGTTWSDQTAYQLAPGRYFVGMRDAQAPECSQINEIEIPTQLTLNIPCPEPGDESQTVYRIEATGGLQPLTYRLSNATGFDVTQVGNPVFQLPEGILPGNFTLRVSYQLDDQTCERELQATLFPRLILNEIPCPDANGNAALQAQGGNSSLYIFGWINNGVDTELARGATARVAVTLPPGTRRYYVVDGSGCRAEREMTNVGRIAPVVPECPDADGLLRVTTNPPGQDVRFAVRFPGQAGPPPASAFAPGDRQGERDYRIPDDFGPLPATYAFYISYGGGECIDSVVAEINRPVALEPLNPICDATGYRLTLVPTPGTGFGDPATFTFAQGSNPQPADFGPNREFAVSAGEHTFWVRDRRGCTASRTLTVSEPVRIVEVDLCPDANGNIRVTVAGGSGRYRYASVTNPQAGDFVDAPTEVGNPQVLLLPAARFTPQGFLTIRDANGPCFAERDVRIEPLTASVVKKDADCFGAAAPPLAGRLTVSFTGTFGAGAEITLTGGPSPITRPLNPNPAPEVFDGLPAGVYRLSIRNPNGCEVIFLNGTEFVIEQPAEFVVVADTVGIRCRGDVPPSGRINIRQVTGQQGVVSFRLVDASNFPIPFNAADSAFTNLRAGIYTLTLEDARGCVARVEPGNPLIIREPDSLRVVVVPQPVSCTGALGRIDINVAGGTKPYRVRVVGQTEQTGNGPRFTFPNLDIGRYDVALVDDRGCSFSQTGFEITRVEKPVLMLNAVPPTCPDATDGQIEVLAGGTSPGDITYRLFNAAGVQIGPDVVKPETEHVFTGLDARPVSRIYSVQVVDAAGCTSDRTEIELNNPPAFEADVTKTDVTCRGANDGRLLIELRSGGLGLPITYVVLRGNVEVFNATRTTADPNYAAAEVTDLQPGTYTVTVTYTGPRGVPCRAQVNSPVVITEPAQEITVSFFRAPENVKCFGERSGEISVNVQNGRPPIEYIIYQLDEQNNRTEYARYLDNAAYTDLARGRYVLVVRDANGCQAPDFPFTIDGPTAPFAYTGIIKEQDETCPDAEDGIFVLEVTGGSRTMIEPVPYRYDLTYEAPDGTTEVQTDLALPHPPRFTGQKPGTYTFVVRDGNDPSCGEDSFSVTITEKPAFDATATIVQDLECEGQAAGSILVTYSGGTEPVTRRLIDPEGIEVTDFEDLSPLERLYRNLAKAGRYTVRVIDADSCFARFDPNSQFELVAPNPIIYQGTPQVQNVRCRGERTGSITIAATGGVGQLTYILTGGDLAEPIEQTTGRFTNLAAGTYRLNVRDSKTPTPCEKEYELPLIIEEPAEALADAGATVTNERCFETNDGSIALAATGGTPPYRYALDTVPNPTNFRSDFRFENLTGAPAPGREYFFTIEDANGCRIEGRNLRVVRPEKVEARLDDVLECSAIPLPYTRKIGPGRPEGGEWRSPTPQIIRDQANGVAVVEITQYGSYELTYVVADCVSEPVRWVIHPRVEAGPDVEFCLNDQLPATHRNPATPPTGGRWSSVGNRAPIDPVTGEIQLAGLQPGLYTFRYEVSPECWDQFDLILKRQPDASFETSEPTSFRDGDPIWYTDVDEIAFINTSTASPSNRYRWDLGDGTTSTDRDVRHIYRTEKNAYTVTLVVRDDEGCEARATKQVRIERPPVLGYPAVFTPNGDGFNDFLELLPHPEYDIDAVIFDRLGNKLYVWSPENPRWDGTINGQPVPETAYFYVIDYTHRLTGRKDIKKGTVTLLR